MGIALYMDQHVPRSVTVGLRTRGVDVVTAHEDGADAMSDSEILDRASELGRVLFSQDDDLIVEAVRRQKEHAYFHGVIYTHQLRMSIGSLIHELEVIAKAAEPEDLINRIQFLPM